MKYGKDTVKINHVECDQITESKARELYKNNIPVYLQPSLLSVDCAQQFPFKLNNNGLNYDVVVSAYYCNNCNEINGKEINYFAAKTDLKDSI